LRHSHTLLVLTSSANAQAIVVPALGVNGSPGMGDVQHPSADKPCGNVTISQDLDYSTPVAADASGNFSPSITNFVPNPDGSRSITTVLVDASGIGKNFVAAQMVVNGDADPTNDATQQVTVKLPAGTSCTGGAEKNLCLASFTTTAGYGNCVVVSQAVYAAGLKTQRADIRSGLSGEGRGMKQTSAAKDKKVDKVKKDKKKDKGDNTADKRDKAAQEHRKGHKAHKPEQFQRITGKRIWYSRFSRLHKPA
ncbi:hypothetical protein DFH94DRAFT_787900, partial [Russula ochroleuca]